MSQLNFNSTCNSTRVCLYNRRRGIYHLSGRKIKQPIKAFHFIRTSTLNDLQAAWTLPCWICTWGLHQIHYEIPLLPPIFSVQTTAWNIAYQVKEIGISIKISSSKKYISYHIIMMNITLKNNQSRLSLAVAAHCDQRDASDSFFYCHQTRIAHGTFNIVDQLIANFRCMQSFHWNVSK